MKRTLAVLGLIVALMLPTGAAHAAPAPPYHWPPNTTVCVDSNVSAAWHVRAAVKRWNALTGGPRFRLRDHCPTSHSVLIRGRNRAHSTVTGSTYPYVYDDKTLDRAVIYLNGTAVNRHSNRACLRDATTTHEIGHAFGLRHYKRGHSGAIMAYAGWSKPRDCGRLTSFDKRQYLKIYPKG